MMMMMKGPFYVFFHIFFFDLLKNTLYTALTVKQRCFRPNNSNEKEHNRMD